MKTVFSTVKEHLNNVPVSKKITVVAMSSLMALSLFFSVVGITGGFRVEYNNEFFTVKSVADFESAMSLAKEDIICENPDEYLDKPVYTAVISLPSAIEDKEDIAKDILESTDGLTFAASVSVNGTSSAYTSVELAEKAVLDTLEQYAWSVNDKVQFVDDVKIEKGYFPNIETLSNDDEIIEMLSKLDVKTISTEVTDKKVSYSTVKKLVSSLETGKTVVTQNGVNGVDRVTEEVTYLNGEEVGRTTVSSTTLSKPVDKIVKVGTRIKRVPTNASSKESASKLGFIYPISRNRTIVTSYWGDGRGHRGIDIAGPIGTNIYAAMAGKVKTVTRTRDYGIYLEIDHGNGYVTRYAHCNAVAVKSGQTVTAGQVIAYVGNTGRSTGPHLHFEIIKNGTRINPAPYIGL